MPNRILDLLLLIVPVVIEWIEHKREEGQSAAEFVRRKQKETLKTYDAMAKGGVELTRLSRTRIAVVSELLRRVRSVREPATGEQDLLPGGVGVRDDVRTDISMRPSSGSGK